jgi:beta-fructofuranosidase
MSQNLMHASIEEAQKFIDRHVTTVAQADMRQRYHFMGQCGWINDPNGLIYFRGEYHLFFQFNPFSGFWGKMYWGHAVSTDLVHWKYLPVALAPSEFYDDHEQGGCFSGSAIEKDGKLYLLYTGCSNQGTGLRQTQNVAMSDDGIHFTKYAGNPVIVPPSDVPQDCFRDPKVWEHEGTYYLVCGAQREGHAQALLYCSRDLLHWEYKNVLFESRGEWGNMWECPDFFQLGTKWVLLCSPIGAGERKVVYFVGDFDYTTGKFVSHTNDEIDWGLDFYAPQTFLAQDNRRIMVGWANEWQWMKDWKDWGPTYQEGWCGSFGVPREIEIRDDGRLSFVPVSELQSLRGDRRSVSELHVTQNQVVDIQAGDGVSFEMSLVIDLLRTRASSIELSLRKGEGKQTTCTVDLAHGLVLVDRNTADGWSQGISKSPLNVFGKHQLDVHMYSDQSSLEIFIDEFTNVHSLNIFAPSSQNRIEIKAIGGEAVLKHVLSFGMQEPWGNNADSNGRDRETVSVL